MQVFKLFFRIVAKNKSTFLIYLGAFIGITMLFVSFTSPQAEGGFESTKVSLLIMNKDQGAIGQGLTDYLSDMTNPLSLPDSEDARTDALYFQKAHYILSIPEDFSRRLMAGDSDLGLERRLGHNSMAQAQVELLISRYVNLASAYREGIKNISEEDLVRRVRGNLNKNASAEMLSASGSSANSLQFYFRYYSYSVLSILILCVSSVSLAVGKPDIRQRNAASPIPGTRQALQLIAGSLVLALALWGFLMALGLSLFAREAHPQVIRLLLGNSLVHTLVCLCLSFMLSVLIKNHMAQSAIANVVTLSMCFLSGVFVPQELLGQTVQRLSSFLPTHWYIRAVDALNYNLAPGATALSYSREGMLIQLGFAAAFLALALLGAKKRGWAASGS